ncbi:MAG: hypothetical protein IK072_02210 [Clostridia bacterium]|nr:hypothetical protein [Clostridia bacterium]
MQDNKYSSENILNYRTAISAIDHFVKNGIFTPKEAAELYTVIGQKYGFNSCSIFAA